MFGITLAMSLVYVFIFHKHFARIMAIADVYDALVSKRVYKERMSFEEADRIIMDGTGKHFDKRLEKFYVLARPRLEECCRKLDS